MAILHVILVISKLLLFFSQISSSTDTITLFQSLPDDDRTLVSKDGTFELGFFNPGSSSNRYVGIWYKNIPVRTVVWVGNRDNPIKDNSSKLIISKEGNLVLLSQNQTLLWSTNSTRKASNPIVQLLDTGNLVLRNDKDNINEENFLWQSFDHPCNTMLPGMKLGWNLKTGLNRRFTAWKNWDDPSTGDFTWGIVLTSNPEMVSWKGTVESYRSGPWNGFRFSGSPSMRDNPVYDYEFVNNSDEVIFTYNLKDKSVILIMVINQTLHLRQLFTWIPANRTWTIYHSIPRDKCDSYNLCGPNRNCVEGQSPICQCLDGFKPKSSQDWTQGCVRNEPWSCRVKDKDGFRRFAGMKIPDTTHSWVNGTMSLDECRVKCWENCSCTAYANTDIGGAGSGCAMWFGDLNDLRIIEGGQDLFIRMVTSDIAVNEGATDAKKVALAITMPLLFVLGLLLAFCYIYKTRRKYRETNISTEKTPEEGREDFELPFFDLATVINATNDFSIDKKLGEGGFGPVYKGILVDKREIAVKRLSRVSRQGQQEFKNEVILCAKLQHRNLVKVIGCCIEGEEKMLLYEYMPNKSLDSFIFDSAQSKCLDWSKRFNIISGIARGLLYLHHDSRLRIIHRDLKASNILLDNEMNPKISDFGLARICGEDQIEGDTSRVVGTYGYMAPEYAIDGIFSIKSDVFSFGILLLEIASGMKNKGIYYPSHSNNLIGHAWKLWKEGIPMKLIDTCLQDSCILSEALRCIQIGLLCVQQLPDDRPNMKSVVVMLSTESSLPEPKEPGFLIEKDTIEREYLSMRLTSSTNEVTISMLEAR
ncbi:G-type lectin S-receptor-like serine/threonine-protein kinase At4g27290 isoform X2 [Gastrolobium bilobum]|uniref:G-type lectin S-receptor-like serine/threonine-protein kinase At4g27290 isoform X2 n=1 Tax=Gastrolobium bilobum TaxID=150636 RepID=UPI002AB077AB|nr:G-type lectin S-receptor-like serine/threonine-protein kinase At4g27290 isoform X2 [Gastrolobium bilobum]